MLAAWDEGGMEEIRGMGGNMIPNSPKKLSKSPHRNFSSLASRF